MGQCASTKHVKEEPHVIDTAQWSLLYENRIVESLPRVFSPSSREGKITHTQAFVVAGSPVDPLRDCGMSDTEDPASHENIADHNCSKPAREGTEPRQTIFCFDWDDTLFSSTWARDHLGVRGGGRFAPAVKREREELLKDMSLRVAGLLSQARTLGKVVIVTSASRSWVAKCSSKLTPEAKAILQQTPVIYAMETMTEKALPENLMCTESKARVLRAILSTFRRSNSELHGWINVVSIGDSVCERLALRELLRNQSRSGAASKCFFTKAIRLQRRPSLMQLNLQLAVISKWFAEIVNVNTHVSVDFGCHA